MLFELVYSWETCHKNKKILPLCDYKAEKQEKEIEDAAQKELSLSHSITSFHRSLILFY